MPSDADQHPPGRPQESGSPEERVLGLLAARHEAFRSAVAATLEELRAALGGAEENGSETPAGRDLGAFAAGRIDTGRFQTVLGRKSTVLQPDATRPLRAACDTLALLAARRSGLFLVDVETGGDLAASVGQALAQVGRAFGASRVVGLVRSGRYVESEHAPWLDAFAFSRWNQTERGLAPPLVVRVGGQDLSAEGLAPFLDGAVQIVLLVDGEAPPAALVRLVSPRVLVIQTEEAAGLDRLVAWRGCAAAALHRGGRVCSFVHDPQGGPTLSDRLRVLDRPEDVPSRRAVAGLSPFQQQEQVRQLEAMAGSGGASRETASAAGAAAPAPTDPVDKLAAWLLAEARLDRTE